MRVTPSTFLPHLKGLRFDQCEVTTNAIIVRVTAARTTACCPVCGRRSKAVHSSYSRTVADRPWSGIQVVLRVQSRRFLCQRIGCPRKVFCERLEQFVSVYGRRTHSLRALLEDIGMALAGRAGERLARRQGTPASRMTLLRLVRSLPSPIGEVPRVVGVDDWCQRKGQSYGSIVCDLERHRPVDLLPDRSAQTWATWLQEHEGVMVISRDRGQAYRDGSTHGAPTAVQVADRWHLLQNAGEAFERILVHEHALLPALYPTTMPESDHPHREQKTPASEREASSQAARRTIRLTRYEAVRRAHQNGEALRAIAVRMGLSRNTVRGYVRAQHAPESVPRVQRRSVLDRYVPYLQRRWHEGYRNGTLLFHEIHAHGYPGGRSVVKDYIRTLRCAPTDRILLPKRRHATSPRQATWFFMRRPDDRTDAQRDFIAQACAASPMIATAHALIQDFAAMVRTHCDRDFEAWIDAATHSNIPALCGFAQGLLADEVAVRAGLTESWSQGQTEGQVNRLKMLKRQMFGRAKLDLLRQRVLLA